MVTCWSLIFFFVFFQSFDDDMRHVSAAFFSLSLMHIHIPNILGINFLFVALLGDASLWRFISLVYYLLFFSRQLFLPHSYFIMFFSFVTRGIVGTSILPSFDLNFFFPDPRVTIGRGYRDTSMKV